MAKIDRESYFDLPVSDQADVLQSLAPVMGRRAEILEKDIWLCQVLVILFQLPCRKPMAFKGGSSLSKVYKAINRFSEDIDVTVDYRSLVLDAPELESISSNSQRSKLSDALKAALTTYVINELVPALQAALARTLATLPISIDEPGIGYFARVRVPKRGRSRPGPMRRADTQHALRRRSQRHRRHGRG